MLFVIATAFGISSTFQAYWMDRLAPHTHPMQYAVAHLLALNLVYWYIPALLAPIIMAFALRHPIDRVHWWKQIAMHAAGALCVLGRAHGRHDGDAGAAHENRAGRRPTSRAGGRRRSSAI